jgi:micrococcal nuclease
VKEDGRLKAIIISAIIFFLAGIIIIQFQTGNTTSELTKQKQLNNQNELSSVSKNEEDSSSLKPDSSIATPETLGSQSENNNENGDIIDILKESDNTKSNDYLVVSYVIDGDTIELESGQRVRYIGIDTPETKDPRRPVQCFGEEAYLKNKELVEGRAVRLEKDVSETDKYGRLLRYIWIDDMMVNELLVREGYAHASAYPPDVKYQELFQQTQQLAQSEKKGLWSSACQTQITPDQTNLIIADEGQCKYSCMGPDKDCKDFSSQQEAQTFFVCCGFTAEFDPMRLDSAKGVGDGIACESLP